MFRVKAVNDEGDSEPLETEAATKAKDPYGKDLKMSAMHAVTVAGKERMREVGEKEPIPSITLSCSNKMVVPKCGHCTNSDFARGMYSDVQIKVEGVA